MPEPSSDDNDNAGKDDPLLSSFNLVGPFVEKYHHLVVDGYKMPHIKAYARSGSEDGLYDLILDDRFGIDCLTKAEIEKWAWFLFAAMAVAGGRTYFGDNSRPMQEALFTCRMAGIEYGDVGVPPESEKAEQDAREVAEQAKSLIKDVEEQLAKLRLNHPKLDPESASESPDTDTATSSDNNNSSSSEPVGDNDTGVGKKIVPDADAEPSTKASPPQYQYPLPAKVLDWSTAPNPVSGSDFMRVKKWTDSFENRLSEFVQNKNMGAQEQQAPPSAEAGTEATEQPAQQLPEPEKEYAGSKMPNYEKQNQNRTRNSVEARLMDGDAALINHLTEAVKRGLIGKSGTDNFGRPYMYAGAEEIEKFLEQNPAPESSEKMKVSFSGLMGSSESEEEDAAENDNEDGADENERAWPFTVPDWRKLVDSYQSWHLLLCDQLEKERAKNKKLTKKLRKAKAKIRRKISNN